MHPVTHNTLPALISSQGWCCLNLTLTYLRPLCVCSYKLTLWPTDATAYVILLGVLGLLIALQWSRCWSGPGKLVWTGAAFLAFFFLTGTQTAFGQHNLETDTNQGLDLHENTQIQNLTRLQCEEDDNMIQPDPKCQHLFLFFTSWRLWHKVSDWVFIEKNFWDISESLFMTITASNYNNLTVNNDKNAYKESVLTKFHEMMRFLIVSLAVPHKYFAILCKVISPDKSKRMQHFCADLSIRSTQPTSTPITSESLWKSLTSNILKQLDSFIQKQCSLFCFESFSL